MFVFNTSVSHVHYVCTYETEFWKGCWLHTRINIIKPVACGWIVSWNCFGLHVGMCVYVCVCVSAPEGINNQ